MLSMFERIMTVLIVALAALFIIGGSKFLKLLTAQEETAKPPSVFLKTLDVLAAQENLEGCSYLVEQYLHEHPELTILEIGPTRISPKGILEKLSIVTEENSKQHKYVFKNLDVSANYNDANGCGALIQKDIEEHPGLKFVTKFISKISSKFVILRYAIVYEEK